VPPPPAKKADGHLVGAFAFLHDLKMGSEFFAGAGYAADAKRCADLYAKVKLEYHATFYDAQQGYYKSGLQTEQAMPLYLGVIPGEAKAAVLNYTMHDIQVTNTMHTTSGIIGIKCMLEALSAEGQTDLALDMVAKVDTYPSYGYMIQGAANPEPATTIWELWDSPTEGPGMNSRNHIMFGTVGSWFYKSLAGITPASAGYATANIAPKGIGHSNFTHADASVSTPYGSIHSSWSLDSQGHLTHTVTVPVGVSATVMVPVAGVNDARPAALADVNIQEGGVTVWAAGKYIGSADGIAAARQAQDAVAFTVGSGRFSFKVAF
jgi:alpha-L-rhamnosidase